MFEGLEDPSPKRRPLTLALIGVSLVVVAAAEHDLRRRSDDQVRGSRLLWRLVSLNAVGAAVYILFGRRRASTP